jgi:4-hydroxyproline epimerase
LIQYSQVIRKRMNEKYPNYFIHPENPTIRDVSHIQWTGTPIDPKSSGRNAVFYGDKAIDRSPCGTGTSARMAQLFAKGLLKADETFVHESYIGSQFIGRIAAVTNIGEQAAIVPSIQGWAKVYGYNTIIIDEEDDPYAHGFQVL